MYYQIKCMRCTNDSNSIILMHEYRNFSMHEDLGQIHDHPRREENI